MDPVIAILPGRCRRHHQGRLQRQVPQPGQRLRCHRIGRPIGAGQPDACQSPVLLLVTAVGTPLDWSPKDLSGTAAKLAQYSYDGAIDLKEWTLRMSGMPECRKMELLLRYDEPDVDSGYFVTQCVEIAP